MSEEFEKWAEKNLMYGGAKHAHNARQSEIDALKAKVQEKIDNWFELLNKHDDLQRENAALKSENERLRKAAEEVYTVFENAVRKEFQPRHIDRCEIALIKLRASLDKEKP